MLHLLGRLSRPPRWNGQPNVARRTRQAGPSEGNPKGSVHQRIKTSDSGKSRTSPGLARERAVFVSHFLLIKLRKVLSNRQLRDEELIFYGRKKRRVASRQHDGHFAKEGRIGHHLWRERECCVRHRPDWSPPSWPTVPHVICHWKGPAAAMRRNPHKPPDPGHPGHAGEWHGVSSWSAKGVWS